MGGWHGTLPHPRRPHALDIDAMIDSKALRNWCMKRPRPDALHLTFENGEEKTIPRQESQSWVEVSQSVSALEPLLIEALAKDGTVLRAIKTEDVSSEPRQRDNARVPAPAALHADPETARICFTADLLHRAYQHATDVAFEKVAGAYEAGFARLVDIVEKVTERSDAIERRLERTEALYRKEVEERIDDALEAASKGEGGGALAGLIEPFIQGLALAGNSKPPNAKPEA